MTYTHREKISVITINLNNAEGLRRTLDSVFRQSTHDFELVVVDGASTDGSVELIHTHADRIDRWVSEPDGGIYNAMNKAVAMATGEYVIFMNSGDTFYEDDVLARVIPQLKGKDIYVGDLHRPGKRKKFVKAPEEVYFHYIITVRFLIKRLSFAANDCLDQPYNEENKIRVGLGMVLSRIGFLRRNLRTPQFMCGHFRSFGDFFLEGDGKCAIGGDGTRARKIDPPQIAQSADRQYAL